MDPDGYAFLTAGMDPLIGSYMASVLGFSVMAIMYMQEMIRYFPKGEVIYTNAFARYDSAQSESPMCNAPQKVNFLLTILYNIAVILLCYGIVLLLRKIIRK